VHLAEIDVGPGTGSTSYYVKLKRGIKKHTTAAAAAVATEQMVQGRGLHSFTFRLNLSTFCGIRLEHGFPPVY